MRLLRLLLVLLLVLAATACGGERGIPLTSWTLQCEGGGAQLTLPAHFDSLLGDHDQDYFLRTHVDLPPAMRGQRLSLTIEYFGGLASLRANGLDAPDGDVSTFERYRSDGPHRFVIPATATQTGALDLEMKVQHRWTQSGWLDTVPRLSLGERGDGLYAFVSSFDLGSAAAAASMILLVSVAYGIVYLADRRRSAYGWFVLASVCGASYSLFTLGLFQPLFGAHDLAAVGFLITTTAVCAIHFTADVFGRKASPWWWLMLGAWVASATLNHGPFRSTRWLSPIAIGSMVTAGFYCTHLLVAEMRSRRPPLASFLATIAWPVVCVLALDDFAAWLSMGELYHGARGASLGTVVVSLLQAGALSAQLMQSLRTSDSLNSELAHRVEALERTNTEVRQLNEEMRHQISNRSRELAETLAKVGTLRLPVLALEPGDIVGSRYKVVGFVGSGGMAWVYEVERTSDGRRLALKLLHGKCSGEALSRFAREARLASEIDHPSVVGIVDVDMTSEGVLYIVMEYVDGRPLEDYLDGDPAISWSLQVLRQIADGLEAVHARGIVHRDLKPTNVLVEDSVERIEAKIVDFGVSSLLSDGTQVVRTDAPGEDRAEGDGRVTRAGQVMGTPVYMAPELAYKGRPVHPSIDMYAFGVMAHELLVGRPPFRDPLYVRMLHGRSMPPPPSLTIARPRLDRGVASVVDRCLAFDPSQRPTAAEAAAALRVAHLEADPSSVPSVRTSSGATRRARES
jgi:serine/threonine-protein kinase